jgi:RimJ/RimL family protein N-acetyltransferase
LSNSNLNLSVRRVETQEDVEHLRCLRNHCRLAMTRDQRIISQAEQLAWWQNKPDDLKAYLYCVDGLPVGFGLLRYDQEKWWATLGILEEWRGQGIGTQIYRSLISEASEELWIEVRASNGGSLKAAARAGFVLQEEAGECCLLKARKEIE